MLTLDEFKTGVLDKSGTIHWAVAVDYDNDMQFYMVSNGGMGNTITLKIESYLPEIKACILEMVASGQLVQNPESVLLLDSNQLVYFLSPAQKGQQKKPTINFNQRALLEIIANLWSKYPELRLMRLLVNAIRPSEPCPEFFYIDDEQLVKKLNTQMPQPTSVIISQNDIDELLQLYTVIRNAFENPIDSDRWIQSKIPELAKQTPKFLMQTSQGRSELKKFINKTSLQHK